MASTAAPRPIRLGIFGTGLAIEKLHWPALHRLTDRFRVVAFANHTRPKATAFAALAGLSMDGYHADYRELLARADVEAVLIALPIPLNLAATRDGLAAGKHVICEKPAGADAEQARAFLALEGTATITEDIGAPERMELMRPHVGDEGPRQMIARRPLSRPNARIRLQIERVTAYNLPD